MPVAALATIAVVRTCRVSGAASAGAIAEAGPEWVGRAIAAAGRGDIDPFPYDLYNDDLTNPNIGDTGATTSDPDPDGGVGSRSKAGVVKGWSSRADIPRPVDQLPSDPIPIDRTVLRTVLGSQDVNATDSAGHQRRPWA